MCCFLPAEFAQLLNVLKPGQLLLFSRAGCSSRSVFCNLQAVFSDWSARRIVIAGRVLSHRVCILLQQRKIAQIIIKSFSERLEDIRWQWVQWSWGCKTLCGTEDGLLYGIKGACCTWLYIDSAHMGYQQGKITEITINGGWTTNELFCRAQWGIAGEFHLKHDPQRGIRPCLHSGGFAGKPVHAYPPQRKRVAVTYTGTSAGLLVLTELFFTCTGLTRLQ